MRTAGMFVLNVELETTAMPTRVSIALTGAVPDHQGVLHVTPNCMSLDELDGYINALQDDLDVIEFKPGASSPRPSAMRSRDHGPTCAPL